MTVPETAAPECEPKSDAPRGSGPIACECGLHRSRCLFGHMHRWQTYYENGRLVRTADTYHCPTCGAVCTAEEAE